MSRPPDGHDALSRDVMSRLEASIEIVSKGGPVSEELAREVYLINSSPLDESAGEGYHRSTNITHVHCPGATSAYIKQSCRLTQNIKLAQDFMNKHQEDGRQVIRFEWHNYKRVLQVRSSRQWTPVRMTTKNFFCRIYRQDDWALQDWSYYLKEHKPGMVIVPSPAREPWQVEMCREYLAAVFKPLVYYSLPRVQEALADDGQLAVASSDLMFQVIKVHTGKSRTHVIPTVESITDKSIIAKLALQIQTFTVRLELAEQGQRHIYADSDPYWVESLDLAPFGVLRQQLHVWQTVGPSDQPGCQMVCDKTEAAPRCALTDPEAPVILVLKELNARHWKQSPSGKVTHDAASLANETLLCDSRDALTKKAYLQCLLDLPRTLSLTPFLPSNEPQAFYRCILAGHAEHPGRGAKHYASVLKAVGVKVDADETDAPVASLADHDDSDEDGIVGGSGGALEAAPAKKAAATKPLASAVKAFLSLPEGSVPVASPAAPVAGDSVAAPASPASSNEDGIVGSLGGAMAAGGVAIMDVEDGIVSAGDAGPVGAGPVAAPAPVAAPVARNWVPAIGGLGMITCQHYTPAGGVGYVNWLLKWTWQGKVWEKTHCVTIIHKPSWPL